MRIEESFTIDAPLDPVWILLSDPEAVATCFPGVELTEVDGSALAGKIAVSFGPTRATFTGTGTIEVDDVQRSGRIEARGRDRRGTSRAAVTATVTPTAREGATVVTVDGEISFSGPLAGFAEAGGVHIARALFAEFADCVARRAAPPAAGVDGEVGAAAADMASHGEPSPTRPVSAPALLLRMVREWFAQLIRRRRNRRP